eukprot:GHRR01033558.1.p1 GENE.GHRR01033558.1~~GHRR01033558.1.p1  ORF type:complete len:114 (-),score=39.22 GHRR01033558.1:355-696(-)
MLTSNKGLCTQAATGQSSKLRAAITIQRGLALVGLNIHVVFFAGKVTMPVVAWVSGTCAKLFKSEVQFGHAGARSTGESDSAQAKNAPLAAAGAIVPDSFEGLEGVIRDMFNK